MTYDQFTEIVAWRFDDCEKTLLSKNKEYAKDGDKLSNFKEAGAMKGETPERALWGMWAKHIISIKKIIEDLDRGLLPSEAILSEKFRDNINYTLLLEALIVERRDALTKEKPPALITRFYPGKIPQKVEINEAA